VGSVNFKTISQADVKTSKFQDNVADAISQIAELERPWPKPGFKYVSSTSLKVSGRETNPPKIQINGSLYKLTEDLICNLSISGAGGLRSGLTLTANTVYYLYAVVEGRVVRLIADVVSPEDGPNGFPVWTYIGAFITAPGSSDIAKFISVNGQYMHDAPSSVTTTSASWSQKSIKVPVTAKFAMGQLGVTTSSAVQIFVSLSPTSTPISSSGSVYHEVDAGSAGNWFGWVTCPILENSSVYMYLSVGGAGHTGYFQCNGWIEDLSEFA
jgi:hypothetical protein